MYLCGEPVPLNEPEVREALDREFTIEVWSRAQTTMWLKRAHRYFPEIEAQTAGPAAAPGSEIRGPGGERPAPHGQILRRGPGPLAIHGPHGPAFQLRCDKAVDERLEFGAATDAALSYLENLHQLFHSWPLALAAYNCRGRPGAEGHRRPGGQ